jgi:hypothetical protein
MTETTRFTFRLGGPGFAQALRLENPDSMVGSTVPVSWGDRTATGTIERVDSDENGVRVTMVIDAALDLGAPPSMPVQ